MTIIPNPNPLAEPTVSFFLVDDGEIVGRYLTEADAQAHLEAVEEVDEDAALEAAENREYNEADAKNDADYYKHWDENK